MSRVTKDGINRILSEADQLARSTQILTKVGDEWDAAIKFFFDVKYRAYLGVFCVTLVARTSDPDIDVTHVKARTSGLGYSAQAIGRRLMPFASEQGIDLRSETSQVMNTQPFTHIPVIRDDLRDTPEYRRFYQYVTRVNALEPGEALNVLASAFRFGRARRIAMGGLVLTTPRSSGVSLVTSLEATVSKFVGKRSAGGRVGQAFGGALFDLAFGAENVIVPKINDPSFSMPGDFRAGPNGEWILGEAKQKAITTGEVSSFLRKAVDAGAWRAVYLALGNENYAHNIELPKLDREWGEAIRFHVIQSPFEAIQRFTFATSGTSEDVAKILPQRFAARLFELGVPAELLDELHGDLSHLGYE